MSTNCGCEPKKYNISLGCCVPVVAPADQYYTKYQTDKKIEEAISGITVSGVTEEQMNQAITSAMTIVEGEIPSLDGYATEQWVENKGYITGVDLSDYATLEDIPDLTDYALKSEIPSLSGYATEQWVSSFTYDKATIDEKVAGGGTFDPTQYYTKTATNALLDEKLDVTAYTPTDLSNYYNKQEVNNIVESAKTEVEAEIPTVPTNVSAFNNDAGYLTQHQSLSAYSTTQEVTNMINQSTSGKVDTTTYNSYTASTQTTINSKADSSTLNNYLLKNKIWCGTQAEYDSIVNKDSETLYLIHS